MINQINTKIKEQSIIKNKAKSEIDKLKEEMIKLSPYKVGDEIDAEWALSDDRKDYSPGDRFYQKLKIKKILVVTVDGGNNWKLGYTLNYADRSYDFELTVPKVKGKKRKWKNRRVIFFEEDFLK